MRNRIDDLCEEVADSIIQDDVSIVILSDKHHLNENSAPIPSLLVVGAVHHYLIKKGIRTKASIIIETGEVREIP